MKRGCLVLAFLTGIVLSSQPSDAQYTTDFQTNIISGVTSNWTGSYFIGSNTLSDTLLVQNGGVLSNQYAYLGYETNSCNNMVVVSDTNSLWANSQTLYIGYSGAGNDVVLSNGAQIWAGPYWYVGRNASSSNNALLIAGTGSIWYSERCCLGYSGEANSLVISNGGRMVCYFTGDIGYNATSSNNSVVVTGAGSTWLFPGWDDPHVSIGRFGDGNSLVIADGGQAYFSGDTYLGYFFSENNRVLVTGAGSVWSNGSLQVGRDGVENSVVVSNGGLVTVTWWGAFVGEASSNNSLVVTGSGSVLKDDGPLWIGDYGPGNRMEIRDEAKVVDADHCAGRSSNSNSVLVASGGVLLNNNAVYVGYQGSSNVLFISDGSVFATGLWIGFNSTSCDNLLRMDSGNLIITNATADAVFEVRNGKLILNGGLLQVDRFVMSNACAQFVRTGGTLIYGTAVLDPSRDDDGDGMPNGWEQSHGLDPLNSADADTDADGDGQSNLAEFLAGTDPANNTSVFRITEIWPEDADVFLTWTAVGGKRYALQTTTRNGDGFTNGFTDLNPAIVAPGTGETTISVLHLDAATNAPSRYYRVRLVP